MQLLGGTKIPITNDYFPAMNFEDNRQTPVISQNAHIPWGAAAVAAAKAGHIGEKLSAAEARFNVSRFSN
jgi:hypothetical protein